MDFPLRVSLDEIFSQLILMGAQGQPGSPRKVLFWGERMGGISSYLAGWMAGRGIDAIVLDGANRFDPYIVSSFAKKTLIPPERLLKRIRIARAFTCYQMATLVERLASLLHQEEAIQSEFLPSFRRGRGRVGVDQGGSTFRKPCVILLGPITTFLDEDVSEKEIRPLFERCLRKMEMMAGEGIPFFLFQSYVFSEDYSGRGKGRNPPFPPVAKGGVGGLMNSKRADLMRRLFQVSNLVWKVHPDEQGPKVFLEKGLTENIGARGWVFRRHSPALDDGVPL